MDGDKKRNSGYCNSGNYNSGKYNSGDYNSGNYNSGYCNSGYCNSGNYNSGNYNSGNCNSGNYNSGNYNSGNYNSGFFCTETPLPTFFDMPWNGTWKEAALLMPYVDLPVCCEWIDATQMSDSEKREHENWAVLGGYLKSKPLPLNESFPVWWNKASAEDKNRFLSLPNFDADKFLKITGVDVRPKSESQAEPAACKEIVIDGQRFRLVPVDGSN